MTNALGNNQILVYHRADDGKLNPTHPIQTIATGGGGSGLQLAAADSQGSAGSLQLDEEHRLLFAVNTETAKENSGLGPYNQDCKQGTITSFLVAPDGTLTFADRVFSGGLYPNSLAVKRVKHGTGQGDDGAGNRDLLYVLNAGGPGACGHSPHIQSPNIAGFKVNPAGKMNPAGSVRAINPGPATGTGVNCPPTGFTPAADYLCGLNPPAFPRSPAQVGFTPDGSQLVVTVKGTNTVYVFPVDDIGRAGNPTITQAHGPALPTFFAFVFDKNEHLLLTEPFGAAASIPAPNTGAVSSFTVTKTGQLLTISLHVGDQGTAACWIALEPISGKYAYVTNNVSGSISSYSVGTNGTLTLLAAIAANASGPNDVTTVSERGASFLYVVDAGNGTVGAFQIDLTDGSLIPLSAASGLPAAGAVGIAAF